MKVNTVIYQVVVILLLLGVSKMYSQTATNSRGVSKSSVIFDLSQIDESLVQGKKAKGFVLPVVKIDNLLDREKPIANPAEGLMVYNNSDITIKGVYMFKNGLWSAIVNRGSSIENAVAKVKEGEVDFKEGEYQTLNLPEFIFNNTYGDVTSTKDGNLHLLPGTYLITLNLAGKLITEEPGTIGDTGQKVRAHLINFRSILGVSEKVDYNNSFSDVLIPMTDKAGNSASKAFSSVFYYAIEMKKKGDVKIQLSTQFGTTYKKGKIKIEDTYVNIEKSIL